MYTLEIDGVTNQVDTIPEVVDLLDYLADAAATVTVEPDISVKTASGRDSKAKAIVQGIERIKEKVRQNKEIAHLLQDKIAADDEENALLALLVA